MTRVLLFVVLLPVAVVLGVMLAMVVGYAIYNAFVLMGQEGEVGHFARWDIASWITNISGAVWGWIWSRRRWDGILLPLIFTGAFIFMLGFLVGAVYVTVYGWEALEAWLKMDRGKEVGEFLWANFG